MKRIALTIPTRAGLLAVALLAPIAQAAPAQQEGLALPDQIIQAHRDLPRAHITAQYTLYESTPEETRFVTSQYQVWYDRDNQQLRIERPGFTLVCDGGTVFLQSDSIPDRHLEVMLDDDLTYDALVAIAPDINLPAPPALMLMLADEPIPWLSGERTLIADAHKPRENDPAARPRIRFPIALGEATLSCSPDTLLLEDVVEIADPKQLAGTGLIDVRWHYRLHLETSEAPFDDDLFTLDTEGSEPCETMAQLQAAPTNQNARPTGGGPTLLGQTLPEIELDLLAGGDAIDLSDLDEGLVIIEFFATWSRPSLTDLGDLEAYQAWTLEEEIDVQILTVCVMEKSKPVRQFFELLSEQTGIEYDLPVLMDVTGDAAIGLGLPTLPRTVILRDGRIVDVLGGNKPEFGQLLRDRTPQWLGEASAAE